VILNLIINAVEAMSSVPEESRKLLISAGKDVGGWSSVVQDSGPGLSPESLDRLFDAFYTTKASGMGMGLSICRRSSKLTADRFGPRATSARAQLFS